MLYISKLLLGGLPVYRLNILSDEINYSVEVTDSCTGKLVDDYDLSKVVGYVKKSYGFMLYSISKEAMFMKEHLKFIGKSSDVPLELIKSNSSISWMFWRTPEEVEFDGETFIFSVASSPTEYRNNCTAESMIFDYLVSSPVSGVDFVNKNIDILCEITGNNLPCGVDAEYIGSFYQRGGKGLRSFTGEWSDFHDGYLDCYLGKDNIYRLRCDAVFQIVGCPLYISKDYDLYLGYTDCLKKSFKLCGTLKYKIKDFDKVMTYLTKYRVLKADKISEDCMYQTKGTPFRLKPLQTGRYSLSGVAQKGGSYGII